MAGQGRCRVPAPRAHQHTTTDAVLRALAAAPADWQADDTNPYIFTPCLCAHHSMAARAGARDAHTPPCWTGRPPQHADSRRCAAARAALQSRDPCRPAGGAPAGHQQPRAAGPGACDTPPPSPPPSRQVHAPGGAARRAAEQRRPAAARRRAGERAGRGPVRPARVERFAAICHCADHCADPWLRRLQLDIPTPQPLTQQPARPPAPGLYVLHKIR